MVYSPEDSRTCCNTPLTCALSPVSVCVQLLLDAQTPEMRTLLATSKAEDLVKLVFYLAAKIRLQTSKQDLVMLVRPRMDVQPEGAE